MVFLGENLPRIEHASRDAWMACQVCHDLIEANDVQGLAERSTDTAIRKDLIPQNARIVQLALMLQLHKGFMEARAGPATQLGAGVPWTDARFRSACQTRDSWLFYAAQAHLRDAPRPLESLPRRVQDALNRALASEANRMRAGECYLNVYRAMNRLPTGAARWVEGVVATPLDAEPVGHAWLEIYGFAVDVSELVTGPAYPPPGVAYFGADFAPEHVADVAQKRRVLEPMGIVLMPPPRWPAKVCPTCEGERTLSSPIGPVLCSTCKGDGRVPA